MQIDIPIQLEPNLLTALLHYDKKLIINPELKGDASVAIYLNGILQELDGRKK